MKSLNDLKIDEVGKVIKNEASDNIRRRLLDIGLVKNSLVTPVLISPGGDMVAYQIKGAIIAIRKEDTQNIIVEEA